MALRSTLVVLALLAFAVVVLAGFSGSPSRPLAPKRIGRAPVAKRRPVPPPKKKPVRKALTLKQKFQLWAQKHRQTFATPADEEAAFQIFSNNTAAIEAHNAKNAKNPRRAVLSSTGPFAGMSLKQFKKKKTGYRPSKRPRGVPRRNPVKRPANKAVKKTAVKNKRPAKTNARPKRSLEGLEEIEDVNQMLFPNPKTTSPSRPTQQPTAQPMYIGSFNIPDEEPEPAPRRPSRPSQPANRYPPTQPVNRYPPQQNNNYGYPPTQPVNRYPPTQPVNRNPEPYRYPPNEPVYRPTQPVPANRNPEPYRYPRNEPVYQPTQPANRYPPTQPANRYPPTQPSNRYPTTEPVSPPLNVGPATGSYPGPSDILDPGAIDWVKAGKVSPIQDQKLCGGCWAWATTSVIESAVAIQTNSPLVKLSEAMLLECTDAATSHGCDGGSHRSAMSWVQKNGLATNAEYPWSGSLQRCRRPTSPTPKITKVWLSSGGSEAEILNVVKTRGPVTASVTTNMVWQHYKSGVIHASDCEDSFDTDHVVTIVGAGTFKGLPVWIIRNSWGTKWGYQGYGYVERNNDACMIGSKVASVII